MYNVTKTAFNSWVKDIQELKAETGMSTDDIMKILTIIELSYIAEEVSRIQ